MFENKKIEHFEQAAIIRSFKSVFNFSVYFLFASQELRTCWKGKPQIEQTDLDKAERQEGHIVSAEQGVEQHFLDAPVEVALQLLHFGPNQFRRV